MKFMLHRDPVLTVKQEVEKTVITIWFFWQRTTRVTVILMKIVSKGFVEGFYYKPRVDLQLLEKYHEGIIALSACLAGEVARFLTRGMYEDAKAAALRYQDIFGKGNFFLELTGSWNSGTAECKPAAS